MFGLKLGCAIRSSTTVEDGPTLRSAMLRARARADLDRDGVVPVQVVAQRAALLLVTAAVRARRDVSSSERTPSQGPVVREGPPKAPGREPARAPRRVGPSIPGGEALHAARYPRPAARALRRRPPWRRAVSAQRAVRLRGFGRFWCDGRFRRDGRPVFRRFGSGGRHVGLRRGRRVGPREARGAPPRARPPPPPPPPPPPLRRFPSRAPPLLPRRPPPPLRRPPPPLAPARARMRPAPSCRLRRERRREVEVVVLLEQAFGDALERVIPEALPSRVPGQTAAAGKRSAAEGRRRGTGCSATAAREPPSERLEYRGRRLRRRRRGAGAGERPGTVFRGFPLRRAFRRERRRRERRRSRTGCRRGCPRARRALYCRARREREGLRSPRDARGCRFASTGEISPSGETSSVAVGRVSGATGESSPRSRRSSSPASMSHAVAIVKARGDGTREKREFDNRRQVARPRVRARMGTRGNAAFRETLSRCGRSVFWVHLSPNSPKNRPEIHGSVRAEKSVQRQPPLFGAFISRSPIAAPRQRHAAPRARRSVSDHGWSAHASRPRGRRTRQARLAGACVARCPRRARRLRENAGAPAAGPSSMAASCAGPARATTRLPGRPRSPTARDAHSRLRRVRRNPSPPQVTSRRAAVPSPPRACRPPPSRGSA